MIDDLDRYQQAAAAFMSLRRGDSDGRLTLAVYGLGVAGEAGEVADEIKKAIDQERPIDYNKIKKELGDVLWYVSAIAEVCGMSMSVLATANIEKLRERYPNGFNAADSAARRDVKACTDPDKMNGAGDQAWDGWD